MDIFLRIVGIVFFGGLLVYLFCLIGSDGKFKIDWTRLIAPRFLRKQFQGQVVKKEFEEVKESVRTYSGTRTRIGPRSRKGYINYFVVFWVDKKPVGFNLSKIQYDMIQEREWYDVSYFKGRVFEYFQIEMPKEMENDPFADYFKQENIELFE